MVPNSITKGSTIVRIRESVRHDDIYLHTLFIYYSNTNVMGYEYEPAEYEETAIRKLLMLFGLFAIVHFYFSLFLFFP